MFRKFTFDTVVVLTVWMQRSNPVSLTLDLHETQVEPGPDIWTQTSPFTTPSPPQSPNITVGELKLQGLFLIFVIWILIFFFFLWLLCLVGFILHTNTFWKLCCLHSAGAVTKRYPVVSEGKLNLTVPPEHACWIYVKPQLHFLLPFQYKEAGETRRSQPPVTSGVGVLFTTSITRKPQPGDYKVRLHKLFHSLSEADKEKFRGEKSNSIPTASTGGLFYFSIQSRTTFHFWVIRSKFRWLNVICKDTLVYRSSPSWHDQTKIQLMRSKELRAQCGGTDLKSTTRTFLLLWMSGFRETWMEPTWSRTLGSSNWAQGLLSKQRA